MQIMNFFAWVALKLTTYKSVFNSFYSERLSAFKRFIFWPIEANCCNAGSIIFLDCLPPTQKQPTNNNFPHTFENNSKQKQSKISGLVVFWWDFGRWVVLGNKYTVKLWSIFIIKSGLCISFYRDMIICSNCDCSTARIAIARKICSTRFYYCSTAFEQ